MPRTKAKITVSVKMYKMGELGDCFLLKFKEGNEESHVLIDCGSFRNSEASKQRITAVVNDIKSSLKEKKIDVVVGTHQHNDHLSGFAHCEPFFENLVQQVWLSWLDNPKDAAARKIQSDQWSLVEQLKGINQKLSTLNIEGLDSVNDVLGFFGASGDDPEIPLKGREALKRMGENEPSYLSPGTIVDLPGINKTSVKVYVLGPPRNEKLLFDKSSSKDETYDPHFALAEASASKILSALENRISDNPVRQEEQFPFRASYKKKESEVHEEIKNLYNSSDEAYRKIDNDWLNAADRLAIYLDS
ncbi:MAG TPA: MBL fold metallo-hydrolase, partial [Segetibacter sp.]